MLEAVVLIHGIWMTGADMLVLRKRIHDCGYQSYIFRYSSITKTIDDNAKKLQSFVDRLDEDKIHFVVHSLGGVVLFHYLNQAKKQKPGRVVLLGSPVAGSGVAKKLNQNRFFRPFLGKTTEHGLLEKAPQWQGQRQVAMIAGSRSLGVGTVFGGLEGDNDGTVSVAETRYPGLAAHKVMKVSHMALLYSKKVAKSVCLWLKHGKF